LVGIVIAAVVAVGLVYRVPPGWRAYCVRVD
jgi:hypothetical protein